MVSSSGEPPGGCFDYRMSRTEACAPSGEGTMSFNLRTEPLSSLESKRKAALVLPSDISLTKSLLIFSASLHDFLLELLKRC